MFTINRTENLEKGNFINPCITRTTDAYTSRLADVHAQADRRRYHHRIVSWFVFYSFFLIFFYIFLWGVMILFITCQIPGYMAYMYCSVNFDWSLHINLAYTKCVVPLRTNETVVVVWWFGHSTIDERSSFRVWLVPEHFDHPSPSMTG